MGQICSGSNDSQINPHMRGKSDRGPTVVSEKKKGYRQTDRHTDKGTLQLYIVENETVIETELSQ